MANFDWMKRGGAAKQQSVAPEQQKPGAAKQKILQDSERERAALKPLDQMPAEQKSQMDAIKARFEKLTRHSAPDAHASAVPADVMDNREAVRQNMSGQGRISPPQSPTDSHAGHPAVEKGAPASEPARPVVKPVQKPPQPTLPRRRGSWER